MKLDKILVPLDGSVLAELALPTAIEILADRPTATLLLLRAAEATALPGGDPVNAQVCVVREAEDYLASVAARLTRSGVNGVKTSVWYGPPAPAIVEAARVGKVNMIVMTTHGRSGLGRLVLGSVAESVLRGTRTPILFVRDGAAPLEKPARVGAPTTAREAHHV
ncbi:MAG: universal stress protein [Candidatus Rokuibacteriota bacterium]